MKNYYKIMLGPKSTYAEECLNGNFIGGDYSINIDLTSELTENWRDFNHKLIPIYLTKNPGKTRIAAGLACGALWTISKGMNVGDVVLSPNGHAKFLVGEIVGEYYFHPGGILPHRRSVKWYPIKIPRREVSLELRNSTNSQGSSSQITKHAAEIECYISNSNNSNFDTQTEMVQDFSVFSLEKHLEDFLVQNWKQTELGKEYDIYEVDGELVGQQYPTDTGPMDILAISKNKKTLLVVELKKGKISDNVVGQIQRYMGYVVEELAEKDQNVKGVIIALENDNRIKRALVVANNIELYRYEISFKLKK